MENQKPIPSLSAEEIRVLGSLVEKSRTTPEYYPLTLSSLLNACNQKSSRKPVVNYAEDTVLKALDQLKKIGLISTVVGGGSRVIKYKHNLAIHYPLVPAELAIICLLFLRGPLTAGEINSNSNRLFEFEDLEEIQNHLNKLSEAELPFVKLLARKPGQKEARYIHLFSSFDEQDYENSLLTASSTSSEETKALQERIDVLETNLAQLRKDFDELLAQLT